MKRSMETDELHGPWLDKDGAELERLRADHPGWRIWRAISVDMASGDWCAQREDGEERLAAPTADGLRQKLAGGE